MVRHQKRNERKDHSRSTSEFQSTIGVTMTGRMTPPTLHNDQDQKMLIVSLGLRVDLYDRPHHIPSPR